MVPNAVLRSGRPILVAAALWSSGCGDGDQLPASELLPRERSQGSGAQDGTLPQAAASDESPDEPPGEQQLAPHPPQPSADPAVGLRLSLPSDAGFNTITYTIESGGSVLAEAIVPIEDEGAVGVQIGNLPPGGDYTITLLVEREALPPCEGSAAFAVAEGRTTDITLVLTCPGVLANDQVQLLPSPHERERERERERGRRRAFNANANDHAHAHAHAERACAGPGHQLLGSCTNAGWWCAGP
jgi:hypothetical protein